MALPTTLDFSSMLKRQLPLNYITLTYTQNILRIIAIDTYK